MFNSIFNVASSAMSASRLRVNTIASNLANANTTRTEEGGPYKRRDVVLAATDIQESQFASVLDKASLKGVQVVGVKTDNTPPRMVYDPSHPDANPETGIVEMPNINPVTEMVNLMGASAAYKAAAEVVSVTKEMAQSLRRLSQRF